MSLKVLELFCGTKSVGKALLELYPNSEIISLDFDPKTEPTILTNILEWDYKKYPSKYFDIIHASPDCTEYSIALQTRPRDFEKGDPLVLKTLEIIKYVDPPIWTIENPATGYLKTRPFMMDLPYYDVAYCKYGLPYKKQTRFWTNIEGFVPKVCKRDCGHIENNRHIWSVGNGRSIYKCLKTKRERYVIPAELLKELFECGVKNKKN
jgi:site-specific DNA-cytosine methylase